MYDVIIVGGGAAGFYAALHIAEGAPHLKIAILEKGRKVLSKVKISGGGRCNVTNAAIEPQLLVQHYPRGTKELLGPFYIHGSRDTISYFEGHGIGLKTEKDGRIFPITNDSMTIINFFLNKTLEHGTEVLRNTPVLDIIPPQQSESNSEQRWQVVSKHRTFTAKFVMITTGGNSKIWSMLGQKGYQIIQPVPSLFSFNIKDDRIAGLQGISLNTRVKVLRPNHGNREMSIGLKTWSKARGSLTAEGPLLITHWGLSGPAILKLSAWGARELFGCGYRFRIQVNWIPDYHSNSIVQVLKEIKSVDSSKTVLRTQAFDIPKKLWGKLVKASGVNPSLTWAEMSNQKIENLATMLSASEFDVNGKSTNKEEFVTAGGIELKQIDFKTFASRVHPNLYFAGEVLNIDGITGGFNFQSAWTGSYIASMAIVSNVQ
ncbi:MAG: aminoacetone oxidase family FAD-binding enzyme [Flavobacteriaceae bacterium]